MKDFADRLRSLLERPLELSGHGSTVRITEIANRWPLPVDDAEALACKRARYVFDERFDGLTFYAVQVFYSAEYMRQFDTRELAENPVAHVCNIVWRCVGLGQLVLGVCEWDEKCLSFPVPKTESVYTHLPPVEEVEVQ